MALQELNYSFISDFATFLRKDYKQRKNTTVKHLRCLKRVVNIAIANRYLQGIYDALGIHRTAVATDLAR